MIGSLLLYLKNVSSPKNTLTGFMVAFTPGHAIIVLAGLIANLIDYIIIILLLPEELVVLDINYP